MSDMIKVSICDGKYTIVQDESGRTNVLRYAEPWRDVTGDNVILGAAYKIEELQARIQRLEKAGDELLEWLTIDGVSLSNQRLLANQWYRAKGVKK